MKSKQLFLLINQIDDELIADAEDSGLPMEVVMERRFPIREILAFAACAAALVIGVFAVVKVRGIDTPPVSESDVTNSSVSAPIVTVSSASGTPVDPNDPKAQNSGSAPVSTSTDSSADTAGSTVSTESSTASSSDDPVIEPQTTGIDSDFPNIKQPFMEEGSFDETLRGIMLRAQTVEQLKSDIEAADHGGRVLSVSVTKRSDKTSEPVTEGAIDDDMLITVTFDSEGHRLRYQVGYELDYDSGGTESANLERVKDTEFSYVVQPFMEEDSFDDALRGIMLRAETVEQLEIDIAAADTEGRVLSVQVTKKTEKVEYYKTGEPVTEGAIEDEMTISVTFDTETNGLIYYVGSTLDYFYGDIISGALADKLMKAVEDAETIDELNSLIDELDADERVNAVIVHNDAEEEITEGALTSGMTVHIEYDDRSYIDAAKY